MKKVCKIVLILLIILSLYSMTTCIYAGNIKDIWNTGNKFLNIGSEAIGDEVNPAEINSEFIDIVDFLWGIGLLIVFIATIVLGIKYMMVSPNEKSRIKQATTPYIIGVVIIFGAVTIWKLVIDLLEGSMLGR